MSTIALLIAMLFFPACDHEDSRNCVWNAQTQGNHVGNSFVDIGGNAYYF